MTEASADHQRLRITAIVSGAVQGVGYRAFVKSNADDLQVAGTAENLPDGRVEVVAEGYRTDLEVLLVRMRTGTTHSAVRALDVQWSEGVGLRGFYVY